jgi:hypothetical protein
MILHVLNQLLFENHIKSPITVDKEHRYRGGITGRVYVHPFLPRGTNLPLLGFAKSLKLKPEMAGPPSSTKMFWIYTRL